MKEYLEGVIDSLVEIFYTHSNVTVETRITEFRLVPKDAIPIGFILNELLTNVFKYAFNDTLDGRVLIKLEKADSRITLTVEDNGIGVDEHPVDQLENTPAVECLGELAGPNKAIRDDSYSLATIRRFKLHQIYIRILGDFSNIPN